MKQSMRANTLTFILMMTLVFISFFAWIYERDQRIFAEEMGTQEIANDTGIWIDHLTRILDKRILGVKDKMAACEALIQENVTVDSQTVKEWAGQDPLLTTVYFVDSNDNAYISVETDYFLEEYDVVDWYLEALNRETGYMSKPYIDPISGNRIITLSKAVYMDGHFAGILGFDIQLENLVDQSVSSGGTEINGYLVESDGQVVATDLTPDELNTVSGRSQTETENPMGELLFKTPIPSYGLDVTLLAEMPVQQGFMERNKWIVLAGVATYLCAIMIFIRRLSETLINPFNQLKLFVLEIKKGNYNIQPYYYQEDEFSALYKGFYNLSRYLRKNVVQLNDLKRSLHLNQSELNEKNHALEQQYGSIESARSKIEAQIAVYSEIVELMTGMLWDIDAEGNVISVSKSFLTQLGYVSDEVVGRPLSDLLDNRLSHSDLIRFLKQRDYEKIDLVFISKNGARRTFETKIFRISDLAGEVKEIQALSMDTSMNQAVNRELEKRSRELAILGELSHEILLDQTVLELVCSFAERLKVFLQVEGMTASLVEGDQLIDCFEEGSCSGIALTQPMHIESSNAGAALKAGSIMVMENPEDLVADDHVLSAFLQGGGKLLYIPLKGEYKPIGVVTVATREALLTQRVDLIESLAAKISMAINNRLIFEKLAQNYLDTVNTLGAIIRAKSESYYHKSYAVSEIAKYIGRGLFMREQDVLDLGTAGLLDYIGIVGLPDALIQKQIDDMSEDEKAVFGSHSEIGYGIVMALDYDQRIMDSVRTPQLMFSDKTEASTEFAQIVSYAGYLEYQFGRNEISNPFDLSSLLESLREGESSELHRRYLSVLQMGMKTKPESLLALASAGKRGENI